MTKTMACLQAFPRSRPNSLPLPFRTPTNVVVTWYRPPDSPIGIFSPFETLIGKLNSENIEYFLMGDLNCDMIATRYDNNNAN